jgi:Fur family transcriptional regulator, iron response regulator
MVNRDELAKLLDEKGVMATSQRLDIAELVLTTPQHLSADQVIAAMRKRGARVSKATVYNTLNLFRDRGLLRTVQVDPERQYYDSTSAPHHHFYNVDTGELIDIPVESVRLDVTSDLPPGTEQAGVDVVIRIRSRPG